MTGLSEGKRKSEGEGRGGRQKEGEGKRRGEKGSKKPEGKLKIKPSRFNLQECQSSSC